MLEDTEKNKNLAVVFKYGEEMCVTGLFAFIGVLIRFSFDNKLSYLAGRESSHSEVFTQAFVERTFLIPNLIGCFIMALCISFSKPINNINPLLLKGLTTGLCGCTTTFSSWMGILVHNFSQRGSANLLVEIIFDFSVTWCAFLLGFMTARLISFIIPKGKYQSPDLSPNEEDLNTLSIETNYINPVDTNNNKTIFSKTNFLIFMYLNYWQFLFFVVYTVLWVLVLIDMENEKVLGFSEYARNGLRSLALTPIGVWIRWFISLFSEDFNKLINGMNLQTLFVNYIAVILNASIISYAPDTWTWKIPFSTGVLGSLSTVSTLFKELDSLYKNEENGSYLALRYFLFTFGGSFVLIQLIYIGLY